MLKIITYLVHILISRSIPIHLLFRIFRDVYYFEKQMAKYLMFSLFCKIETTLFLDKYY